MPLTLVRRFSGAGLSVPELPGERDRAILSHVLSIAPALGSGEGWGARFGRELNATDDRKHFGATGLPVLEGKLLDAFSVNLDGASRFVERQLAKRLLGRRDHVDRVRLGYREVAASTNRVTLIAAMIPGGTVTTHTILCLREPRDEPLHWYLCGVFNSFVANYLVRLRGGTHVPAAVIHQLPVPVVPREFGNIPHHRETLPRGRAPAFERAHEGRARRARDARVRDRRERPRARARDLSTRTGRGADRGAQRLSTPAGWVIVL